MRYTIAERCALDGDECYCIKRGAEHERVKAKVGVANITWPIYDFERDGFQIKGV